MKYTYRFFGKEIRAIGAFSEFTVTVDAESAKDAHMKLYDTHEHLHLVRLVEKPKQ
jgi:hypothetical protein